MSMTCALAAVVNIAPSPSSHVEQVKKKRSKGSGVVRKGSDASGRPTQDVCSVELDARAVVSQRVY